MYDHIFNPKSTKAEFYSELLTQIQAVLGDQRNWVTNLANASALIFHGLNTLELFEDKPVNWAGFYFSSPTDKNALILGPFQGKVACTKITLGKGVCGTAALSRVTQLVTNVHDFPGHIACDSESLSEIVVPLITQSGELIGVLDIDDKGLAAFDQEDRRGLEAVAKVIVQGCDWTL